jgi:hypothetical protein
MAVAAARAAEESIQAIKVARVLDAIASGNLPHGDNLHTLLGLPAPKRGKVMVAQLHKLFVDFLWVAWRLDNYSIWLPMLLESEPHTGPL